MDMDKLKDQFKTNAKDSEELRRRRVEELVKLRKATKDEQMTRRRNIDEDEISSDEFVELDPKEQQNRLDKIIIINNLMTGNDPAQHLKGLQMAHKFLKTVRPRPIDLFIAQGIVSKLVEYLKMESHPEMQYIACWVLTTIAFGNHKQTNPVVQAGAVDVIDMEADSEKDSADTMCDYQGGDSDEMAMQTSDRYDELDEYLELIEEAEGKELMEQLQTHENATISSRATYILDKYFNDIEITDMEADSEKGSGDTICDCQGGDSEEMAMQVSNDVTYDFN